MVTENRSRRGAYSAAFSLHIPDMRVKIAKICPRPVPVLIERVFRGRIPEPGTLLAAGA
jgi:hypothetical protein